jgi:hypothetical protein
LVRRAAKRRFCSKRCWASANAHAHGRPTPTLEHASIYDSFTIAVLITLSRRGGTGNAGSLGAPADDRPGVGAARIVLRAAAGQTNTQVAHELRATKQTVGKRRSQFIAKRVDGLLDEPRPGGPRTVTDAMVEEVVRLTLESQPRDATHWSTRGTAGRCGLSQSTVTRIWRAFGLQPHRTETFKLSSDPLLVDKVRDIVSPVHGSARSGAGPVRGR